MRDHVTAVFVAPLTGEVASTDWTSAVNCADWLACTDIETGVIDMEMPIEIGGRGLGRVGWGDGTAGDAVGPGLGPIGKGGTVGLGLGLGGDGPVEGLVLLVTGLVGTDPKPVPEIGPGGPATATNSQDK